MRGSPAHCRATLAFTLDVPPAVELCPGPQQQLPVPLCSAPESSIPQQRQADRLHAGGG